MGYSHNCGTHLIFDYSTTLTTDRYQDGTLILETAHIETKSGMVLRRPYIFDCARSTVRLPRSSTEKETCRSPSI